MSGINVATIVFFTAAGLLGLSRAIPAWNRMGESQRTAHKLAMMVAVTYAFGEATMWAAKLP